MRTAANGIVAFFVIFDREKPAEERPRLAFSFSIGFARQWREGRKPRPCTTACGPRGFTATSLIDALVLRSGGQRSILKLDLIHSGDSSAFEGTAAVR
jgi:hypothetical protein